MRNVDVAIIGAGSAGLSARSEVAKVTDDYVVIDRGPLGTTCARVGCMPSKAFIQSANAYHRRHDFEQLGIRGGDQLRVDRAAVLAETRRLRDYFVSHVVAGMARWRDDHLIEGAARFNADGDIEVAGQIVRARRIILATGSSPVVPRRWRDAFGDRILDTDGFFELDELPASVAVVGLGVIGAEIGQALARLGVSVTAFDPKDSIGGLSNPELQQLARESLSEELEIVQAEVDLEHGDGGRVRARGGGRDVEVDRVFAAMGRRPNLHQLGLDALGIELGNDGLPPYDRKTLRIDGTDLYVAGDASGDLPVLHEASDGGRIAGYNAARHQDHRFDRRIRCLITFSDPEIAMVGRTFAMLRDDGVDFVTGEASFADQGRARVARRLGGAVRIYVGRDSGALLGAEMFAPSAEHFAHMLARELEAGGSVGAALRMPFYHPVYEEGIRTALRDAARKSGADLNETEALRCEEPAVCS